MLDGIKFWVKDLTIDKQIDLLQFLFHNGISGGVTGHGGMGHSVAYVIEIGRSIINDYINLTKISFYQMPEKEANVDYLLSLVPGQLIDKDQLLESDLDRYFRLANLGPPLDKWQTGWDEALNDKIVPKCCHDFQPVRGLSIILGYDCKKCGIKQEDV